MGSEGMGARMNLVLEKPDGDPEPAPGLAERTDHAARDKNRFHLFAEGARRFGQIARNIDPDRTAPDDNNTDGNPVFQSA